MDMVLITLLVHGKELQSQNDGSLSNRKTAGLPQILVGDVGEYDGEHSCGSMDIPVDRLA
jgi:hypothetical protein